MIKRNKKNKLYQSGGQFPNAESHSQLGTIPNNRTNYQPSITNKRPGRPSLKYSNNKLFNCGGHLSVSINKLDKNDLLHPGDSQRLSYRDDPVGMSITMNKSNFRPYLMQLGGNIANTPEDFSEGLNKGKNIFPFNRKGLKKMTMTPESGNIEYPIDYEGYTDGIKTDSGTALPGEDFTVDGDTVVETPDLSIMNFNEAIDYAHNNNLPIFNWKGNKYPVKKNLSN
tara:strand:+ start:1029 stop:1706 length:678 start_codon:yes stop_codon:yes gene_type:complete